MTPTTYIKQAYDQLVTNLLQLQDTLQQHPPPLAITFELPTVPKEDESKFNTQDNPDLVITPLTHRDAPAIEQACRTYLDLHVIAGLSQRSARRTPGVLWLPNSNPMALAIEQLVFKINEAKAEIKNQVVQYADTPMQRFDLLKDALPATLTLHLYRQIRCFYNQDIKAIRFNWIRQHSLLRANKANLIEQINEAISQTSSQAHTSGLQELMALVQQTPEENLRLRRQQPIQPSVNIRAGVEAKYTPHSAAMPFIIIQPKPPAIKELEPYGHQTRIQRKPRSDRKQATILGYLNGYTIESQA